MPVTLVLVSTCRPTHHFLVLNSLSFVAVIDSQFLTSITFFVDCCGLYQKVERIISLNLVVVLVERSNVKNDRKGLKVEMDTHDDGC